MSRIPLLLLLSAIAAPAHAGELKVDINRDGKDLDQYTETGFVKWSAGTSAGSTTVGGTTPIVRSFTTSTGENVTITFAQTAASSAAGGTGITFQYYQAALEGTAKLIGDGLTVAPANFANGGQLQMTITGLAAGAHTLLTYHNAGDAIAAGALGPIDISVNGAQAINDLPQTIRALVNSQTATSYVSFTVSGPTATATILFAAEPTAGSHAVRNPMINGFEIDTPNIYRIATSPYPKDQDGHVDADSGSVTLSWSPALSGDTASRNIYFGTDVNTVKNATTSDGAYLGNQAGTTKVVTVNNPHAIYYWRIDEINTSGETTKGTVWSFRPRHLAFPGAEGYGRFARGGRGGRVVHVTSLADYNTGAPPVPGTLRYAVEQETGPRVIVFDVGGLITLKRRLTLSDDFVTVAGQTAPGLGICLREWPLGLSGSDDSVVRYLRNRPGDISGQTIDGGGLAGCNHSIMDHCSISWSIDEAFSGRSAKNMTLQRTLISEALNIAGHQNYPAGTKHGYAATISGDIGSYHHNLLAHCEGRNWSLGGGLDGSGNFAGRLDIRNNVVYNWGNRTTDGGAHEVNFVGNYYKPGAATTKMTVLNAQYDNFPGTQQYYMAGNVRAGTTNETDQTKLRTVAGVVPTTYPVWVGTPFFSGNSHITEHTAVAAYKSVLSDVGANRPLDPHDTRVIQETLNKTYTYTGTGPYGGSPGLPNSQTDVGGWDTYPTAQRPADWDRDGDGLPGWWETLKGTNPDSAPGDFSDSNADPDVDGYTHLDDYLAWMAAPHVFCESPGSIDVDLSQYTRGYTAAPVHAVSAPVNGTVQLLGDGKTARFTSTVAGLGIFDFSVTDSAGDSMTGKIGVRVVPGGSIPLTLAPPEDGTPAYLIFRGPPGATVRFQHTDNFLSWPDWATVTASGELQSVDVPASYLGSGRHFFRATSP